jgi:60 kDa SS-A/Ro ribonucleoprotein
MANFGTKSGTRKRNVPQVAVQQPIPNREAEMVPNGTGGLGFAAGNWAVFRKFLILGSVGSYYVDEPKLTEEDTQAIVKCLQEDYTKAIGMIVECSTKGQAVKNDFAVYALAVASDPMFGPQNTALAFNALPSVCRIAPHLFLYNQFADQFRGWGSARRRAVAQWYNSKSVEDLAYQAVKYQGRNTIEGDASSRWSHRDLFRKAHPSLGNDKNRNALYDYIVHGTDLSGSLSSDPKLKGKRFIQPESLVAISKEENLSLILGYELLQKAKGVGEAEYLIGKHRLSHEMVPTQFRSNPQIWAALLPAMPATAMIRTLGRLTAYGLLDKLSKHADEVIARLTSKEYVVKNRLHPIAILVALQQYRQGKGDKGSLTWSPNPAIISALETAFENSFDNVVPTGKRLLLGVDVSGSMSAPAAGSTNLNSAEVSALMSALTMRAEKENHTVSVGFDEAIVPFPIHNKMSYSDIMALAKQSIRGGTDCTQPIKYAIANKLVVDAIVIYSDNEANVGGHVSQAIEEYRKKFNKNCKLVCVNAAMTAHRNSDPKDPLSIEIVGFSTDTPSVISYFLKD